LQGMTLQHTQLEASLRQEVWLLLRASPTLEFQELRRTSWQLINLLSVLVGEPISYKTMIAQSPSARESFRRKSWPSSIDILSAPIAPELVETVVEEHRMLLRFRDVQAHLPGLFRRWLESCNLLQPAFDLYFSMQLRDPGFQELRFLGLVQALESLHRLRHQDQPSPKHQERLKRLTKPFGRKDRRWLEGKLRYSHEPTLSERITDLLQPFGDLFGEPEQRKVLVKKISDTRNYLTHYSPDLKHRAIEPSKLLPYLFRLRVLFILHCLLELSFSAAEARQLVENNDKLSQMVRFGKL